MPLSSKALANSGLALRTAVVALYMAWVVVGFCKLRHQEMQPAQLGYRATRYLPVGRQLHSSDFDFVPSIPAAERNRLPAWLNPVGKYLLVEHLAGQLIPRSELTSAPVFADRKPEKGKTLAVTYWFPLAAQPDLIRALNAGSVVDVCAGLCTAQKVQVLSVVCTNPAASSDCYAALDLPKEIAEKLPFPPKDYRLIARSNETR